jgi:hypothetical protein
MVPVPVKIKRLVVYRIGLLEVSNIRPDIWPSNPVFGRIPEIRKAGLFGRISDALLVTNDNLFSPVFGAPTAGGVVADFIKKSHNLKTPKAARPPARRHHMAKDNKPVPTIKETHVPPAATPATGGAATREGLVVPTLAARRRQDMPPPPTTTTTIMSRPELQRFAGALPLSYSSDFSTGADHYFDSHVEFNPPETEEVNCKL